MSRVVRHILTSSKYFLIVFVFLIAKEIAFLQMRRIKIEQKLIANDD